MKTTRKPTRRAAAKTRTKPRKKSHGVQIVVLDRGFVYVGRVTLDGDFLKIDNAKCIRRWGTTKGLGELRDGPTSTTKLDDVGTVIAPLRATISLIAVDESKWSGI